MTPKAIVSHEVIRHHACAWFGSDVVHPGFKLLEVTIRGLTGRYDEESDSWHFECTPEEINKALSSCR